MLADRKLLVDAAIMKVMKKHKTLKKTELVSLVISQVQFLLEPGLLESRI